jgi:uncharacterized protein YqgC (DUF456 family)
MTGVLSVIGYIVFYVALGIGVLLTPLGLSGTWVILIASVIFGWATGFESITAQTLGILALIAVALEVLEYLLAVKLAQKLGTPKQASWAAVAGGIIGGIWGTLIVPVLGSLIGALAGVFLGATIWEMIQGKSPSEVSQAGRGALLGRGGALVVKTIGAIVMVVIVIGS